MDADRVRRIGAVRDTRGVEPERRARIALDGTIRRGTGSLVNVEADRVTEVHRLDPLLVERSAASDEARTLALANLYRANVERLIRIAASITLNRALADELVHDAFEGLQRRFGSVDDPAAYLQRSVINLSLKVLRRRRTASRYPPPQAALAHNPDIDEAWSVVRDLPPRQRTVVALRYWHDMSEPDIARTLGWPVGTVKSTLHRALSTLRDRLPR